MDGLQKITQRILDDAQIESQKLISEGETKASAIRADQREEATALKLKLEKVAKAEAEDHKKRLIAAAELEMRKDMLSAKRSMLDKAFANSVEALKNLPLAEYSEAIKSMLLSLNFSGEAEIVFSTNDKGKFDGDFAEEMNTVLKAIGKDMKIKLSEKNGEFDGGFMLLGNGFEINNTLLTRTNLVRDELEPIIAKILFSNTLNRKEDA